MIERPPSERGPNSMRPWNQPTTFSSARIVAQPLGHRLGVVSSSYTAPWASSCALIVVALETRSQVGAAHGVVAVHRARLVVILVPGDQRRAQRTAGIAGRRLDPDVLERPFAQDAAIGHAVERDAAGQAQVVRLELVVNGARQAQHDLLGHRLDGAGDIHLLLRDLRLRRARRRAEQVGEPFIGHGQTGGVVEIVHVQAEGAVRLQVDQLVEDQVDVLRLAVGRQPHQLVFAGIHPEAGVIGKGRVQHAQRVREVQLPLRRQLVALAQPHRGRGPLAHPVQAQHGRASRTGLG